MASKKRPTDITPVKDGGLAFTPAFLELGPAFPAVSLMEYGAKGTPLKGKRDFLSFPFAEGA